MKPTWGVVQGAISIPILRVPEVFIFVPEHWRKDFCWQMPLSSLYCRKHHIFKFPGECLIACKDMLLRKYPAPPLQIMEVPTHLQDSMKFYVDWDMALVRMTYLKGNCFERVTQARLLALQTLCKICEILVANGCLQASDCVQVVVKEVKHDVNCATFWIWILIICCMLLAPHC